MNKALGAAMLSPYLPNPWRAADRLLASAAVAAIVFYQRHLSPHKGYCCAYRVHTGRCSCSEFARRFVLRAGCWRMLHVLPRRFAKCRAAHLALAAQQEERRPGDRAVNGGAEKCCAYVDGSLSCLGPCYLWPF
jgi:putative component of membrane protein insertase Oxa1/YidC/SpoIIIJ protein YidD